MGDPSPEPIAPENMSGKPLKFLDIHPLEIARQLTLITSGIYNKITCKEITELMKVSCVVKGFKCPWIDRVYKRIREVAFWAASEIVLCVNPNQRLTVLKRLLQIAEVMYRVISVGGFSAAFLEIVLNFKFLLLFSFLAFICDILITFRFFSKVKVY